jgi:hypothetical protein
MRLNQVMRRVRLDPLPGSFTALLPAARNLVLQRKIELLDGVPTTNHFPGAHDAIRN